MANHVRELTVSAADWATLAHLVAAGLSRRARAVRLMADRMPGTATALRTGYTPVQSSRIRARFAAAGLEDLVDRARSGRPEDDLAHWNDDPTPFVWTKESADIIKKAVRH